MTTSCKQCGKPVPPRVYPGGRPKVFCSDVCRVMLGYWRQHEPSTNRDRQLRKALRQGDGVPYEAPELSEVEAAWVAAILDGEGNLSLHRHNKRGLDRYLFPMVSLHNTDQRIIDRFVSIIGSRWVRVRSRKAKPGYRKLKTASIARVAVADVLWQLLPWFVAKDRQAALLIEFCRDHDLLRVDGGCTDRMVAIFHEMRALNLRGRRPDQEG